MNILIIPLILLPFIFERIFPYLNNLIPVGYDPGFYLYLFKKYSEISLFSFNNLPPWLINMDEIGIGMVGKFLTVFFLSEKILIPLIIFFSVLLFFSVYFLSKKLWGEKTAFWSSFIFACSAIQFRVYWYFYLKNIAAMSFLLFAFYFLSSGSYLAIIFSVLVFYFHRPTAIILLITLLVSLIFQKKERKYYSIVLISTLILSLPYYIITYNNSIKPLIGMVVNSFLPKAVGGSLGIPSGSFFDIDQFLLLSLPYLFFGLYGFYLNFKQKKNLFLTIPFIFTFIVVFFRLFFSRRIIPFFDLFLIIFAGFGVVEFSKSKLFNNLPKFIKRTSGFIYALILIVFISICVYKTGQPLITEDEFKEIRMLNKVEENAYILVTDAEYTPWVYGWSDRKPIAPGFGEYDIYWTTEDWFKFWKSGDRDIELQLLQKLPKPLYIYSGDHQATSNKFKLEGECFEKINYRTYRFLCSK